MVSKPEALRLMMPLADAVQFSLFLCREKPDDPYTICGSEDLNIEVAPERTIKFKSKVIASGVNEQGAYVILQVMGDLWALVYYDSVMKELNFSLIDAEKLGGVPAVYNGKTMKALYDMLLPSIVGMWMREERNDTWSRLDEVEDLGTPAVGVSEETNRATDSVSTG